ncbi:MAG: hypothetical protein ABI361_05365 [Nitrososphaera sp.]|jgi:hypothetical protein
MSSKSVIDSLTKSVERAFDAHEDISYIAAVNSKLKVLSQKGFIDLHPSKIHVLHVQAALLVGMSSVWSESLGRLDYTSASFNSKSEILVFPVTDDVHVLALLSPATKKNMDTVKQDIVHEFKA